MKLVKISSLLLGVTFIVSTSYAMKYAKVIGGPYQRLKGKIAHIAGTSKDVWGIEDVRRSNESFYNIGIINYLRTQPPLGGLVYYGDIDGFGYCFHETWLQEVSEEEGKNQEANKYCVARLGKFSSVSGPKGFVEFMQQLTKDDSDSDSADSDTNQETAPQKIISGTLT